MTIGIVLVALLSSRVSLGHSSANDHVNFETHQLGGEIVEADLSFPSAYRYSMAMFFPST